MSANITTPNSNSFSFAREDYDYMYYVSEVYRVWESIEAILIESIALFYENFVRWWRFCTRRKISARECLLASGCFCVSMCDIESLYDRDVKWLIWVHNVHRSITLLTTYSIAYAYKVPSQQKSYTYCTTRMDKRYHYRDEFQWFLTIYDCSTLLCIFIQYYNVSALVSLVGARSSFWLAIVQIV